MFQAGHNHNSIHPRREAPRLTRTMATAIPAGGPVFGLGVGQVSGPIWAIVGVCVGAALGAIIDNYASAHR